MSTPAFYDALTPYYHLIYPDWQVSMDRQGRALDAIIRSERGPELHTILDAACGIGTQSLAIRVCDGSRRGRRIFRCRTIRWMA